MQKIVAFDKNGLVVELQPTKGTDSLHVKMTATNKSIMSIEQYLFQVSERFYSMHRR